MKKKLLKSASLVALSAVMMCGAAATFAGCGNDAYTISISMFCGDADIDVNDANVHAWAAQFTEKLISEGRLDEGQQVDVDFSYQTNTDAYFSNLSQQIMSNSMPDVFYVSPKYVKAWRAAGKILDLAPALAEDSETLTDVWEDSLAFYSYSDSPTYSRGDRIEFKDGKFVTIKDGSQVGIYGLPKDYSNFGLGFNEVFFSDAVREAVTTKTTSDRNGALRAEYNDEKSGNSGQLIYNSEDNVIIDAESGENAPIINIGRPTYYKPYNFYKFGSYTEAVAGGDPMASAVEKFTGGKGYLVTIPGFPGDTLKESAKYWQGGENLNTDLKTYENGKYYNENAVYDADEAYVTYTYAEYGALTWAMTYYINTFNWDNNAENKGGAQTATTRKNVYGNDQYDGVLYLLPWLAGNDAQYLNADSTTAINGTDPLTIGTDTYETQKTRLNGENETVDIQYGINSERYIETVGAFHAYGSDWNGNSNNAGDTTIEKSSGWDLFVGGNCIFYGVGTWNAGALNATDRQYLKYRLMPEPVSESYALDSVIKDADYNIKGYGAANKVNSLAAYNQYSPATKEYTAEEIFANQMERQDKWGARMDSVGYGVSSLVTSSETEWREDAAIDLVKYLTITPSTQVTLTYAGSQLPNFKSQCQDFYDKDGDFDGMITPDEDDEEWEEAYGIAKELFAFSQVSGNRSVTIGDWFDNRSGKADVDCVKNRDKSFDGNPVSSLSDLSYAMKILRLVAYKKADRDLSLRMQFGLNATRDSAMYTYTAAWLTPLEPRGSGYVMAYDSQTPYPGTMGKILDATIRAKDAGSDVLPQAKTSYGTPAWFCLKNVAKAEAELQKAINAEKTLTGGN